MASTGKLTISGSVTGGLGGPKTIGPATINLAAAVEDRLSELLEQGDNTIAVPAGATICVVIPPDDNVIPLGTGAGGVDDKAPNIPFVQTFPAAATSFIVNASDSLSALTIFDFA